MWEIFRTIHDFVCWLINENDVPIIELVEADGIEAGGIENDGSPNNFLFSAREYHSSIIYVDELDKAAFNLYVESKGESYLFRTNSGDIWIMSTHFDRNKKLDNNLKEFSRPTSERDKPGKNFLWSSFINKEDNWFQFIVNEKGCMIDFFTGDVYIVATKLNNYYNPVCFIDSAEKLAELNQEFGIQTDFDLRYYDYENPNKRSNFDWPRFYEQYSSLIILDYYWVHRLSIGWYYGFDCTTCLNLKAKSTDGSALVKVQKLSNSEINLMFYDKILESKTLELYEDELSSEEFNVLTD
jgi:hypothetical protein